jgi:putative AlgH/UPF0301 family transcriptional regulator
LCNEIEAAAWLLISLGRTWKTLDQTSQRKFSDLLGELVVVTYADWALGQFMSETSDDAWAAPDLDVAAQASELFAGAHQQFYGPIVPGAGAR